MHIFQKNITPSTTHTGFPPEIQALVNAVAPYFDHGEVDLSGACISDADLRGADLREVDLSGANVSKADLSCVYTWYEEYLRDADFSDWRTWAKQT